jgi:hypothetical protein
MSMASRAVDGLARPPFTTAVMLHAEVTRSSQASGPRCRNDSVIGQRYGDHGQTMGTAHKTAVRRAAVKRTGEQDKLSERTTGFEPATLTLANVMRTLR